MKKFILFLYTFLILTGSRGAARDSITERFIDVDRAQLFCRTLGKGDPLIVLHGGPGLTQDYLLPHLYQLAQHHFVIFYDQRGCGKSTGLIAAETINLQTYVNDLESIRKAFHLEKFSLLGHSWGGFLAMEYALAHPEIIDKLILSNSMPASSEGLALFVEEWKRRTAPYQEEISAIHNDPKFEEGNPILVERFHYLIFRTYCHDPEKANLLDLRTNATAAVNGLKVHTLMRQSVFEPFFDLHNSLKTLSIPTLIIHGDDDPIPFATAETIHGSLRNSEFVLMRDCGHFPYVEDPGIYFSRLEQFLMNRRRNVDEHRGERDTETLRDVKIAPL